jgi:hypothetical protein
VAVPSHAAELDAWSARVERLAGWLLVAGCVVPLLKRSLVFGSSRLVWPWQLMGFAVGVEEGAAMATEAGGDDLAAWALLPLAVGLIALALPRLRSIQTRGVAGAAAGAIMLALLLVVLAPENAVLGLAFTPPTRGAGVLMLIGIGACALLAAANHVAKTADADRVPRWLVGTASAVLVLLTSVFMLAAQDVWAVWSMRLVYVLVVFYGLLNLWRTLQPHDAVTPLTAWSSRLARAILVWSVLAVVLAQSGSDDGFVAYVVAAGGGPLHVAVGAAKGFLIFAGGGILLAAGLATALAAGTLAPVPRAAVTSCVRTPSRP